MEFALVFMMKNQKPGSKISDDQILEKLEIIKPYVSWIRTFFLF